MSESTYTPPRVWQFNTENGGQFAGINLPTAGARFEQELPRGDHPFQLYSMATPNGVKVTILFEELLAAGHADAEYDAWPIRIYNSEQFGSGFTGLNPNSKIPALLDVSEAPAQRVFESGNILLYLAEKFGAFLPEDRAGRTETLNWLFWQMGAGPFLGGGFGHFFTYAPEPMEYPINRFTIEVKRQLDLLNQHLAANQYMVGDTYTIADMAIWPWYARLVMDRGYPGAAEFLSVDEYTHILRWARQIDERPAVQRGRKVNNFRGEPHEQCHERHSAADLDALTQTTAGK